MQVYVRSFSTGGGEVYLVKDGKGRLVADGNTSEECTIKAGEIQEAVDFATGTRPEIVYSNQKCAA